MILLFMFSSIFHSFLSVKQRPRGGLGLKQKSKHAQPSPWTLRTSKLSLSLQKPLPLLTISQQHLVTQGTAEDWTELGWSYLPLQFQLVGQIDGLGRQSMSADIWQRK